MTNVLVTVNPPNDCAVFVKGKWRQNCGEKHHKSTDHPL